MTNQLSTNATAVSTILPRDASRESTLDQMRRWHARLWRLLSVWKRRSRDRAVLRSLSPQAIHDFCPRQSEADAEMNKPFWRA
jgi:uncharacterized protein YjiS (DUF1127 family)